MSLDDLRSRYPDLVAILFHEPGWRRLYANATAIVHVRDAALEGDGLRGTDGAKPKSAVLVAMLCFQRIRRLFLSTSQKMARRA
jgi:hypothetical protein